jgi:DNA-binding transcriptional LysR family regulator
MLRRVPSLAALRVFVAAARHQNFRRAADQLALTESAVSRQIASLERQIGVELFTRSKKRVVLTQVGEVYAGQVSQALGVLEGHTLDAMARGEAEATLELASLPTLAAEWLIPRLPGFAARHPRIVLNISTRSSMFDFDGSPFDAAIHCGDPNWPKAQCSPLFGELSLPVCHRDLLRGQAAPLAPAAVAQLPLIHLATRRMDWHLWFEKAGVPSAHAMRGPCFEQHSLLASAVQAKLGVALLPQFVARKYLDDGTLVSPCPVSLRTSRGYYLVIPDTKPISPSVMAFRDWLVEEAQAATLREFETGL